MAFVSADSERRVIIHCDDIGMCHAANLAVRELLTSSPVRSGSVMVPCPWAYDFVRWLTDEKAAADSARAGIDRAEVDKTDTGKSNTREADIGIHATLTSEWATYRWRPVSPAATVAGLVDPDGFLWRDVGSVAAHASAAEVRQELLAQVERARAWGLSPTHVDTHMGTVYATPAFLEAYLAAAGEHQLPPMLLRLSPLVREEYARAGYPVDALARFSEGYPGVKLDYLVQVPATPDHAAKKEAIRRIFEGLPPGLSQVIIHPAADTPELRAIFPGWQQRVWDLQSFLDPETYRIMDDLGIRLTTWAKETARA